jgi:hypothetical protein
MRIARKLIFGVLFLGLFVACSEEEKLSSEASITGFEIESLNQVGTISGATITMSVPYGTDISNLSPTITVSEGATLTPASGLARDFTSTVGYTVTAEDGKTTSSYSVTISALDPDTVVISNFEVSNAESVDIDQDGLTITVNMLERSEVTSLTPVITTIPSDATSSPASGEAQDFSSSVDYTITAGASSTTYTASVNFIPTGFDPNGVSIYFDGSVASSTLPPELSSSGDNERGFSFNSTHVYVADKGDNKVYFWDHSNQSSLAETLQDENNIISGGVWKIADVVATENGIIASNMNWSGGNLNIYRWADNDSSAEKILTYTCSLSDGSTVRYGDQINFVGDPQGDGHLYVMAFPGYNSIPNNNYVLVWEMVDGVFTDQANPTTITFADLTKAGNYGIVQPVSTDGVDYLLVNGAEMAPTLFSLDGQQVSNQILSDAIGSRAFGVEVVKFNYSRYLVLHYVGGEGGDLRDAGVLIYDISEGTLVEAFNAIDKDSVNSKLIFSNSYGQNINGNQGGDVKTFIDSSGENLYFFSGATNNGFRVLKASKSQ